MSVEDFLNAQPIPPMGPETLGLGPAPAPPALPMPGQPQKRNPMDLAALALAAMLGPGKGTGILQGVQQAKQQQQQERAYQDRQQADLYRRQQEMYQWQQQQYEADATRRQNALESNVKALQSNLPTLKTKAAYDQTIDTFAAGLQQMGLRVDGNYLRSRVPYVAPDGTKSAVDAIERWKKNPQNEKLLKENPEQASIAKIPVDRDGDGVPEMLTLDEAMTLAGMPFTREENGKIAWAPAGTTQADKANADGIYADLLAKDQAEGKADTPERRIELRKQAMRQGRQATDLGPDPTLQAIRELQLDNARNKPAQTAPTLPPATQRRVDVKAKAFESLPVVKRITTMAESVSFAQSLKPNTTNPADDQALIYAFAKAMDPDSVVREGEYATVQKYAQSWAQSFGFNAARVFSNTTFLTPQARANMKATILSKFQAAQGQYDNVRRSYAGQINRMTNSNDGDSYLTDYGAAFPEQPKDDSDIEAALKGR